ncbi:hypothetical protein ACI2LF_40330 [Kribbella sp. NPDC020789]
MTDGHALGPEIGPDSWEYRWVAHWVRAVEERTGQPTTWNGRLYEELGRPDGTVLDDGTLAVSREHVTEPAKLATTANRPLSQDEANAAAQAYIRSARLGRQSQSTPGDATQPGATPPDALESTGLDNALVESWTQRNIHELVRSSGLDDEHVGYAQHAWPAYRAATDQLLATASGRAGVPPAQLRAEVEETGRAQRFGVIADRIIDHRLGGLVPEAHRTEVRAVVEGPFRRNLRGLAMTELSETTHPGTKLSWGHESAELAGHELDANLDTIEDHYRGWQEQNPGTEPPRMPASLHETFHANQDEVRDIWAERGWPALEAAPGHEQTAQEPEQRFPSARDQEIARLQEFLGTHTASSGGPGPSTGQGEAPNNVRKLGERRGPERGA